MMFRMFGSGQEPDRDELLKSATIKLCLAAGAKDVAARFALGELSVREALMALYARNHDPELLSVIKQMDERMKKRTPKPCETKPDDPLKYITKVEMLEAQSHGISNETYVHNKTLPLSQRLKLPVWEAIFALNYKEKRHNERKRL